jgi:hypothetical protein
MRRHTDNPAAPAPGALRVGMRVWLTAAFAAVSLITAAAVYLFGDDRGDRGLLVPGRDEDESSHLADSPTKARRRPRRGSARKGLC